MALTGLALLNRRLADTLPPALAQTGDEVLPWLDQPAENPVPERVTNLLEWEALDAWITPADQFFSVSTMVVRKSRSTIGSWRSPGWWNSP
jgi:hypothetical protein